MKVIDFKSAAKAVTRRRYAGLVLQSLDRLERDAKRQRAEKRADVERKAREAL